MAKDPAFLFYPGDWLGGTLGMSFEEKGAYFELLMLQFNRGHMTSHMIGQVVGHLWDKVKHKFVQDGDGLWYNERLEQEKKARLEYVKSRKNNKNGKNQYSHTGGHMTYHMENEDEDENKNVNEIGIEDRKAKFNLVLSQYITEYGTETVQSFSEYWTEHNPNGRKMRYEMERVFDIPRRLKTWKRNEGKFKRTSNNLPKGHYPVEEYNAAIRDIFGKRNNDPTTNTGNS